MKYRLMQGKNVVATFADDYTQVETEIVNHARKMSFYRSHKEPVIALGAWPGIALWKIKVTFTTDVEMDFSYKTEEVRS